MVTDQLLEEIKKKYPIGTIINCLFGNTKNIKVIDYKVVTGRGIYTQSNTWILLDHKYAEIIFKPEIISETVNDFSIW